MHFQGLILVIRKIRMSLIMPLAATWEDLEIVILSKLSQTEGEKCHMISLICRI